MKKEWIWIVIVVGTLGLPHRLFAQEAEVTIDDIIRDIYEQAAENGEEDFEEWQQNLNTYLMQPININQTSYDELAG